MNINKILNDDTMTLFLEGWLDTQAAPELETAMNDMEDGINTLVFDCKDLEYISSSGIRQFVAAHKKMNGNLILRNVSKEITDVLNMTGVASRIKIE